LALLGSFGSTFGEAKVEKRKKHRIFDCTCIMNNTNESFIDFLRADYLRKIFILVDRSCYANGNERKVVNRQAVKKLRF
jgi:hypothetical protein